MIHDRKLATAHMGIGLGAFGIATFMALMQALSRANLDLPWRSAAMYYLSVTGHGVLMALVFTTFVIMGMGTAFTTKALDRPLRGGSIAWAGFWVALVGTLAALWAIFWGKASVLYTFYPPMQAHPAFYIGLTLLVVGSWLWCGSILATYLSWRRDHTDTPVPLAVHGIIATVIVWLIATVGVAAEMLLQLIPWSLGLKDTVDPLLARMLFWYFGHPLVYFWLIPAYVVWYAVAPKIAGGRLFSDPLARMVFVLFVLLSTPVGFHHQFMDPGITSGWKLFHMVNTMGILFPSFVTAFTVVASLEIAARLRGGKGLFRWVMALPWGDPLISSVLLSMILFAIGGFGGAINAAFGMNAVVHNTAWIQGHFHLTVGTATALTFMGVSYWLVPKLVERDLELSLLAKVQPFLWFFGMLLFSIANHVTGVMGMPRRVYDATFGGSPVAAQWEALTLVSAFGGLLLFVSASFFLLVMLGTVLAGRKGHQPELEFAETVDGHPPRMTPYERFTPWVVAAVILVVVAYAYPLWTHFRLETFGSPGFRVF